MREHVSLNYLATPWMTDLGPNFTGPGLDYQWLPRSEVAGRFFPADQAGHRPEAVTHAALKTQGRSGGTTFSSLKRLPRQTVTVLSN
jgi:hypothetical protein